MNLFDTVKAAVTPRMAAERYGLPIQQGSMVCCPFHADRTPSMKLNEDYFYCFGCGAHGDVIDLVARLFNLNSYDAAKKLTYDFGIDSDKPPAAAALRKPKYLSDPRYNRASGRLSQSGHQEYHPAFWARIAPSNAPKDADNRTISADSAVPLSGTPLPADILASAALPRPGACPGRSQSHTPAFSLRHSCSG